MSNIENIKETLSPTDKLNKLEGRVEKNIMDYLKIPDYYANLDINNTNYACTQINNCLQNETEIKEKYGDFGLFLNNALNS